MAIAKENIIVYQELLDYALNNISKRCANIGQFASNVPAQLKNGTTWTVGSYKTTSSGKRAAGNTLKAVATVDDSLLNVVSEETVKQQLRDFMASRGIASKDKEIISFKSILNFYNNLAAFISAKLVYITNSYGSGTFVFYNPNTVSIPAVNTTHTDYEYSAAQVQTTVNDLMNAVNNKNKIHYANTTLVFSSSSSSCTSCSSCCCSSSSSSSSLFVAYMDY